MTKISRICLFVLCAASAVGQGAPVSLQSLIAEARQNNAAIKAAGSAVQPSEYMPKQASALPDTEVMVQSFTVGSPRPFAGYSNSDFAYIGFGASQELPILGDGTQSKSYIHVDDVIDAVLTALRSEPQPYRVYNVATGDYITVTEIAELAVRCVGLAPGSVRFVYSGGDRGWKGDIPVVRLNTDRIRALGWANRRTSRAALQESMLAMIPDARAGRL